MSKKYLKRSEYIQDLSNWAQKLGLSFSNLSDKEVEIKGNYKNHQIEIKLRFLSLFDSYLLGASNFNFWMGLFFLEHWRGIVANQPTITIDNSVVYKPGKGANPFSVSSPKTNSLYPEEFEKIINTFLTTKKVRIDESWNFYHNTIFVGSILILTLIIIILSYYFVFVK